MRRQVRPVISRRRVKEFREAFTGEIDSLVAVYRRAAAESLEILSNAAESLFQRRRAKALLRQYHEVLAELRDESAAWISSNLPASYQAGIDFADEGVRRIRRAGVNLGKPQYEVFAGVHREAVAAIVEEMQKTVDVALAQIGRRVDDVFRKVGMQEISRGIAEGRTRVEVSREIESRLRAEGQLKFTTKPWKDKAGQFHRGQEWELDRYTEMVARTTTREAMTQGTVNRLQEHNIELAQVSAHNSADFCHYYENVVVSLTGEAVEGYPPISAINGGPPFHPNCAHVLTPFVLALATDKEQRAGKIDEDLLDQTPAQLQRRFREDFPDRAKAEGRRLWQQRNARRARGRRTPVETTS